MPVATLESLMEQVSALSLPDQFELQQRLARLLEAEEDHLDLETAQCAEAAAEGQPTIPWKQVKLELGLSSPHSGG